MAAWTQSEENFLREFYPTHGAKWCAGQLSRSEDSTRTRAHKIRLRLLVKNSTHRKLDAATECEVIRLYVDEELSAREIAERLSLAVGLDVIYDALERNAVGRALTGTRNRRWTDEEESAMAAAYEAGRDTVAIARDFKTSQSAVLLVLARCSVELRAPAYGGCGRIAFTDSRGRRFKMRSSWEIATASWLDDNQKTWDYESETFRVVLDGRLRRYTPDFWIFESDSLLIVDIKGIRHADQDARIAALKLQRPDLNIEVWDYWELKKRGVLPGGQADRAASSVSQKEMLLMARAIDTDLYH